MYKTSFKKVNCQTLINTRNKVLEKTHPRHNTYPFKTTLSLHTPPRWLRVHTGPKPWAKATAAGRRVGPCSPAQAGRAGAVATAACTERLTLVPAWARPAGRAPWRGGLLLASQHTHHAPATLQSSLSGSHHGWVQAERAKISQAAVTATA